MPSASPGSVHSTFDQILPGAPNDVLQSVTTFVYRHERYVAYLSGSQLNLLSSPGKLVHTIRFAKNLTAVTAHHTSGRLVVATQECAYLLEPVTEGWKTIWWEKRLLLSCDDEPRTLSWSKDDELLVGGSKYLNLFSTTPPSRNNSPAVTPIVGEPVEERRPLWNEVLASPVQYASFSSTADMIASCGPYSKLIKIWRRLSFEDGLFDYTYLPHPATVTHLEWRMPDESAQGRRGSGISGRHDEELEVLYTIANDGLLRVWRSAGVHDIEILTLHTVIDLVAAIPHSPSLSRSSDILRRPPRFVFILTAEQFHNAVLAATGRVLSGKLSHSLEHLKEISSNSPDVIVSIDSQGRMSAWGLQSVGHKRRPESPNLDSPFHIMQTEGLQLGLADVPNARFQTWFDDDRLQILAHTFDGKCTWWQGQAETFFSHATPGAARLEHLAEWSGHNSQPKSICRNPSTGDLSSWDESNSIILWEQSSSGALRTRGKILGGDTITDSLPLHSLGAVLTLHESQLKLWNTAGKLLQKIDHSLHGSTSMGIWSARAAEGQDRNILLLNDRGSYQIVTVTAASKLSLSEMEHAIEDDAVAAVATDDGHGGLIVVSLDAGGILRRTLTRDDPSHRKVKTALSTFDTGITVVDSLSASTAHAFIVSQKGRRLAIFDTSGGYKEHEGDHGEDISHVSCFTSKSGGTMVATAHRSTVDILVQDRYKSTGAWSYVQSVEVHSMSLRISGLNWTAQGELLILAGNGILQASAKIADSQINAPSVTPHGRLSALADMMRLPLPIWHPGVLQYLVRSGRASSAIRILGTLSDKLRFWTEGDHVPWQLDLSTDGIMRNVEEPTQTESTFTSLLEQIDERGVPLLTSIEQDKLRQTITAIEYIAQHMRGLDLCALQYLFSWKLDLLRLEADKVARSDHEQPNGHEPGIVPPLVPDMNWREITFAYHSTTQQPLWDLLILHYDNKMTWEIARRLGVTMWLADREALARVFESLAQSAYRATNPPDPTHASLYFLALDKKPTLLSLWRIATWHNEQRMTMNFLKRDFAQPSAQTAAKKNAYALMGRRRFEYAAAFFLLANDGPSAVSLLAGQCEDVMLAVAVARLYANQAGSSTLQKLLQERLLPQAQQAKDRWLTCWCHSLLDQNSQAAEALISPLQGVRTWQQDDPQALTLYRLLRKKPSHREYASVLRSATILRRMGLWLPALNLVKEWIFKHSPAMMNGAHKEGETTPEETPLLGDPSVTEEVKLQPPSMLDDYATPPPIDDKAVREAKAAELLKKLKEKKTSKTDSEPKTEPKREPTQFKEPDPNSLLDSFGF